MYWHRQNLRYRQLFNNEDGGGGDDSDNNEDEVIDVYNLKIAFELTYIWVGILSNSVQDGVPDDQERMMEDHQSLLSQSEEVRDHIMDQA